MLVDLEVPKLGESVTEAKVSKVLVKAGDSLRTDQIYLYLHTDKTDIELPSTFSGVVVAVLAREGDTVQVGGPLLTLETDLTSASSTQQLAQAPSKTALLYFSSLDPDELCSRSALGDKLNFNAHKSFVEEVVSIAKTFRNIQLSSLSDTLLSELDDALYFVTDLISPITAYEPGALGQKKLAVHNSIVKRLDDHSEHALDSLREILQHAQGASQPHDRQRRGWVRLGHEDRAYVFISHHHSDRRDAEDLAAKLSSARIQYFLDTLSIIPGEAIDDRVHEALNHASHIVALLSAGSEESAWVPYEMGYARAKDITLVPYLLHEKMKVPEFVRKFKYIHGQDSLSRWVRSLKEYRRSDVDRPFRHEIFSEWRSAAVHTRLGTAEEVWHQAVSSYTFLNEAFSHLMGLVERGGSLRCVLVDPSGDAIKMALRQAVGAAGRLEHKMGQIDLAQRKLSELSKKASGKDRVSLRTIDHLPEPVMTILDPRHPDGTMFVTLNGFEQRHPSRPSFVLQKAQSERWFEFYRESFENIWAHPLCKNVPL